MPLTGFGSHGYLTRSHLPEFQGLISNSAPFDVFPPRPGRAGTKRIRSGARRTRLKTTLHSLVGWMALATVLWARVAVAGPVQATLQSALGAAIAGQSAPAANPAESKDQQAADLVRRARQAMSENDLDAADSLISKAESLGVQYGPFYMGDTPKKARRDLERKRNAAAAEPAKPSGLFAPLGPDKDEKAPSTDPFAGRNMESQPAAYGTDLRPLPRVDGTASGQPPLDRSYPVTQPGQGDVRAPADHRSRGARAGESAAGRAVGAGRRRRPPGQRLRGPGEGHGPELPAAGRHARAGRERYPQVPGTLRPGQELGGLRPHLRPQHDGPGRRAGPLGRV